MDQPRPAVAPTVASKRLAQQRRAKRGLVAGYIHGLSERHGRDTAVRPDLGAAGAERTAVVD